MKTDRMPRLALPPTVITQDSEPLHQHRRLAILRRVLNDDSLPLRARVAAAPIFLDAQPVSRIVRLTVNDVTDDETTVTVRLGDPPSPLPEPVADLMRADIQSRQHLPYASSRSAQRLFPGRQPGQPMNSEPPGPPPKDRRPAAARQGFRDPPVRPPSPGTRHREGSRLPRHDRHPPGHRSRRDLEPIRFRRPPAMKRGTYAGSAEPRLSSTWTTWSSVPSRWRLERPNSPTAICD